MAYNINDTNDVNITGNRNSVVAGSTMSTGELYIIGSDNYVVGPGFVAGGTQNGGITNSIIIGYGLTQAQSNTIYLIDDYINIIGTFSVNGSLISSTSSGVWVAGGGISSVIIPGVGDVSGGDYNVIGGQLNAATGSWNIISGFNNDVVGDYNGVIGDTNKILNGGSLNSISGDNNILDNSYGNDVNGQQNLLYFSSNSNDVSGVSNIIGSFSGANIVGGEYNNNQFGSSNLIYGQGNYNDGFFNLLGGNANRLVGSFSAIIAATGINGTQSGVLYTGNRIIMKNNGFGPDPRIMSDVDQNSYIEFSKTSLDPYIGLLTDKHISLSSVTGLEIQNSATVSTNMDIRNFGQGSLHIVAKPNVASFTSSNIYMNSSDGSMQLSATSSITVSSTDFKLDSRSKLFMGTASNSSAGKVTLVAGSATVNTTSVQTSSIILLTVQGGTLTNVGSQYISARTAGTSFTISSLNILDTSTVGWVIIGTY